MTTETLSTLNTSTLIGNTRHRGTAWHYRAEEQGEESNHYPGRSRRRTSLGGCSAGRRCRCRSPSNARPTSSP